jgi:Rrf2 family transcriptional regulator, iron-sulfur cluster assembly transcription factor
MVLSRPSIYAIRALTYLASQPAGKLSGTHEISTQEVVPESFLCKVLLNLRRGRLLRSYKGIGGGYELAVPAEKISLLMVTRCIDGEDVYNDCIMEDHRCRAENHCALHSSWDEARRTVLEFLERNTIADLARAREPRAGPAGQRTDHELRNGLPDQ